MTTKHQLYQALKAHLANFLKENFSIKLETDATETQITKAQVNTREVLNSNQLEEFRALEAKYNFKNTQIGRSGPGVYVKFTM